MWVGDVTGVFQFVCEALAMLDVDVESCVLEYAVQLWLLGVLPGLQTVWALCGNDGL